MKMDHAEGELLARYARERDAEAFRSLLERHRDMVFATSRRILGNATDAEDVAQDCFILLSRNAGKLRAPVAGWLHQVAVRISLNCIRQRRAQHAREIHAAESRSPAHTRRDAEPSWDELQSAVDEAIARLPEKLRVPIILYYLEERKQEEIASELRVSQAEISRRLQKGVEALRHHLKRGGFTVPAVALATMLAAHSAEGSPPALISSLGKLALSGVAGSTKAVADIGVIGGMGAMKIGIVTTLAATAILAGGVVVQNLRAQAPAKVENTMLETKLENPQPVAVTEKAARTYTVTIEGRITDAATGKPVPDADVGGWVDLMGLIGTPDWLEHSTQQTVKTRVDGRYRLELVTPLTALGEYKGQDAACLTVSAPHYGTRPVYVKGRVRPTKLAFNDLDVALNAGRKLNGRLVDEQHKPVDGARLTIRDSSNGDWDGMGAWGSAISDENGRFEIWINREKPKDMGGRPYLMIFKQGCGMAFVCDILQKEDMGDLVLPTPTGRVTGKVVDPFGNAVAGCTVDARFLVFGRIGRSITDANGNWEMDRLPEGDLMTELVKKRFPKRTPNADDYRTDFYARMDVESPLSRQPGFSVVMQRGERVVAPDIVLSTAPEPSPVLLKADAVDPLKAELMGRVEMFVRNHWGGYGEPIEWSDVTTDEDGNRSIEYDYYEMRRNDKFIHKEIFGFDPEGNLISMEKLEGYPEKVEPDAAKKMAWAALTETQGGLAALVEAYFAPGGADITARATIEWGPREAEANGEVSIRYKYTAAVWGKQLIMNQLFTFNPKGELLSTVDVKGYPQEFKTDSSQQFKMDLSQLKDARWSRKDSVKEELTWYALPDGLAVSDAKAQSVSRVTELLGETHFVVTAMAFGADKVWVGTNKGLFAWDRKDMFWTRFAVGGTMLDAPVTEIELTKDGALDVTIMQDNNRRQFEFESKSGKWKELPGE